MTHTPAPDALPTEIALRLSEFARACKAATRSVSLYPDGHPAITGSLSRLVDAAARATAGGAMTITVLPDALLVDNRAPVRPDPAIAELADLLHSHLVGELRLMSGADPQAWRAFLLLLARTTEDLLTEGGIGRLWATTGGAHLQIREIDYAEVLRERKSGVDAAWDSIVANCLSGDAVDLDSETMQALLEIAGDPQRLSELTRRIDEDAAKAGGVRAQARALVRLLRFMAKAALVSSPERLDEVLKNAAQASGSLSPDVMLELLTERYQAAGSEMDVISEVVDRMSDATIAAFVATSVVTERGATARLAQAFQALVPEAERRESLVALAESEVAHTPLGRDTSFQNLWQRASEMLLSYRDEKFVSTDYARELSTARSHGGRRRAGERRPARTGRRVAGDNHGRRDSGPRPPAAARPAAPRGRSRTLAGCRGAGRRARRRPRPAGRLRVRGAAGAGACRRCRPAGHPGAPRHGRRRTRAAGRRSPDGAHGRPPPDDRRRGLRARQGAVSRAGRRGHPAAGRGPGRRGSRARVSSSHRRAGQFRQPGPRRGRAAQELAEPRRATHGDLPAPRVWRQRRAAGTGAAARGRRRQRPARGHPCDRDHRHRRGLRAARKGPDVGIGPLARRDPRGPGHPARRTRPAVVPPHRPAIASTAARRARSTSRRSKRWGRWAGARPSRA